MKAHLVALLTLPLGLAALACSDAPAPATTGPAKLPEFPLRDVVRARIAALETQLSAELDPTVEAPEDIREQVDGLVTFLTTAKGNLVDAAFEDVKRLGPAAVAPLITLFREELAGAAEMPEAPIDRRRSILRLLGDLDTPASATFLAEVASTEPSALLRSTASWKLAGMEQDFVVPELLKQLTYEKDPDAVVWLVRALAAHGNYSGLSALNVLVARQGADGPANVALWDIARGAGYDDPFELRFAWDAGDPALAVEGRSARYELALWRRMEIFTEFQLRGVDDSRNILSSLGQESAATLAEALHDENRYIRVHVAQSIGRMVRRGEAAAPMLAAALGDSIVAPNAAEALAEVASTRHFERTPGFDAYPPLAAAALPGRDPGLRLAAVRALGVLGDARALDTLRELAQPNETPELRQAALEGLVLCSDLLSDAAEAHDHLRALGAHLDDPYVDPGSSLRAMLDWLQREHAAAAPPPITPPASGEVSDAAPEPSARFTVLAEALDRWNAWAPNPYVPPSNAENAARRAARLAIVAAAVDALAGGATELTPTPEPAPDPDAEETVEPAAGGGPVRFQPVKDE